MAVLTIALLIGGNMVLPWLLPLLLVLSLLALFTTGIALLLAACNVFFHDVNYLWGILVATSVLRDADHLRPCDDPSSTRSGRSANYGPTGSFIVAIRNIMYDLRMPGARCVSSSSSCSSFGVVLDRGMGVQPLSPRFAEEM